jgi:hypothetical protein
MTPAIRTQWGFHDARADRARGVRFPMPLLQQRRKGQPTFDVDQIAPHHFDRAYARGYALGWKQSRTEQYQNS